MIQLCVIIQEMSSGLIKHAIKIKSNIIQIYFWIRIWISFLTSAGLCMWGVDIFKACAGRAAPGTVAE